jgi:hypothetical protein
MTAPTALGLANEKRRKQNIQAIKACQRQLGLDDATYRAMLEAQTGKRSATDLTVREGGKVLDYLRAKGATNPKARPDRAGRDGGKRRPAVAPERAPLMGAVHALLDELARITGEPHSLAYADAICKRNGWASAVDFMRPIDLHLLLGALATTARHKKRNPPVAAAPLPPQGGDTSSPAEPVLRCPLDVTSAPAATVE